MTKNKKLGVGGNRFDGSLNLMSDFHFFVFVVSKAGEVLVEDIALKVLLTSSDVTTCPLLPHLIHRLIHPQTVSLSNLDFSLPTFTCQYQLSLFSINFLFSVSTFTCQYHFSMSQISSCYHRFV